MAVSVRLDSFRFSTGVCSSTGGRERRPMAATTTRSSTANSPYCVNACQPASDTVPPPTSTVRSVCRAAFQKIDSAKAPAAAAMSLRHHGSFFGFQAADSSATGGSGA